MLPTSLILTTSFLLLLLPQGNTRDFIKNKEKEVENLTNMSINLHLRSTHKNSGNTPDKRQNIQVKPGEKTLELSPESFTDTPLQMEEWMKSPKNWNNKNY